jgi:hypothetical protein
MSSDNLSLGELLTDWPYARTYLLETMDVALIERHAEMILSRALNLSNVVGFISAGVSMAYGRISWKGLVVKLETETLARAKEVLGENNVHAARFPRIATLTRALEALSIKDRPPGGEIKPERYPTVFQLCAELAHALAAAKPAKEPAPAPAQGDAFDWTVKSYTIGSQFHDLDLLQTLDPDAKEFWSKSGETLKARILKAVTDPDNHALPADGESLFLRVIRRLEGTSGKRPAMKRLLKDAAERLRAITGATTADVAALDRTPCRRFLVVAALRAAAAALDDTTLAGAVREAVDHVLAAAPVRNPAPETAPGRPDSVIEIMRDELGVRRFLTTNFDLELEQAIYRLGFTPQTNPDRSRPTLWTDRIGRHARDFVVSPQSPGPLIDFAAGDSRFVMDVAHLHGRALPGEPLVALETQYQAFYLRDDGYRQLLDQSIMLAFRANTLLFVGNGMGEDDLLRPLRQFMSETPGATQPASVALLPNLWGASTVVEEKIALLRQYGVYTIHWGKGRAVPQSGDAPTHDLLPAIKMLLTAVRGIVEAQSELAEAGPKAASLTAALKACAKVGLCEEPADRYPDLAAQIEAEGQTDVVAAEWAALRYAYGVARDVLSGTAAPARLAGARAVMGGLEDAMLAGFLQGALKRLTTEWREWRGNWFNRVTPRVITERRDEPKDAAKEEPKHEAKEKPKDEPAPADERMWLAPGFRMAWRHKLELADRTNEPDLPDFRARWSQAYADFLGTLKGRDKREFPKGRRVYFIAGRRGVGKGHLFAAMSSEEGFLDYCKAVDPKGAEKFAGAFFLNLSFSAELSTGFDRLNAFLRDCIEAMLTNVEQKRDFKRNCDAFLPSGSRTSGSRVGALRYLMRALKERADASRIAIVINGSHLLFTKRGYAKNAEFMKLVTTLLDAAFADARIDLFLIGGETRLPLDIRRKPRPARALDLEQTHDRGRAAMHAIWSGLKETQPERYAVAWLKPTDRNALDLDADEQMIATLGLAVASPASSTGAQPAQQASPGFFFYRMPQPRISVMMVSAFPRATMALAIDVLKGCDDKFKQLTVEKEQSLLETAREFASDKVFRTPRAKADFVLRRRFIAQELVKQIRSKVEPRGVCPKKFDHDHRFSDDVDRKFGRIYKRLNRSRFCVSILGAAAEEAASGPAPSVRDVIDVIDRLSDALVEADDENREDTVIRLVMERYRRQSAASPLPHAIVAAVDRLLRDVRKATGRFPCVGWTNRRADLARNLFILQEEVLAALALTGMPIEADCLAALDSEAFGEIETALFGEAAPPEEAARRDEARPALRRCIVERALAELLRRCLVFRFAKLPGKHARPRYAVHRLVQRHVFRRLHQPRVEMPELDDFMPTLYALQPNDLPNPSPDTRGKLNRMFDRLSSFPSRRTFGPTGAVPAHSPREQAQMLRAAYGLARTSLRFGVMVRPEASATLRPDSSDGALEEHRRKVRWLLRRAGQIETPLKHALGIAAKPVEAMTQAERADFQAEVPFFTVDQVWLLNECGVLSLAQGHINDAARQLAVAIRTAQRMEAPTLGGAATNALLLNRSVVDIEAGRMRRADSTLRAISETAHEHRALRWVAIGYTGVVAHLSGDLRAASRRYEAARTALKGMQRYRAASIFARHHADLERRLGHLPEALAIAEESVNLASIGNHVDIYHTARLARLWTELAAKQQDGQVRTLDLGQVRKTIEDVRAYGRLMAMPRIDLEALRMDYLVRLMIGDLHHAHLSITEALALAGATGMQLRRATLLLQLAKLYLKRGLVDDACLLADSVRRLSLAADYSVVMDAAQEILTANAEAARRIALRN